MPPDTIFARLHATLTQEAALIRGADFGGLDALAAEKERLMQQLCQTTAANPEYLSQLRRHADRNQALIAAALRGVKAARRRFASLIAVQTALQTYDSRGHRHDIAPDVLRDASRIERRA